ncbi:MAG: type VII toxin-antitoxin system MntA family adenylyltransferase antitoxin [Candidatus Caldatribacteriaceae bacterium]
MIRFKKLPEDIHDRIEKLKDFLSGDVNIIFAYLFGGLARKKSSTLSDVDIAVYVKDPEKINYLKLYSEITDLLSTEEVDLVILNKAPLTLLGRILQSKKILVDKDRFLRHKFESLNFRKFFDFQYREREYFEKRLKIG